MSQYVPALTSQYYRELQATHGAMEWLVDDQDRPGADVPSSALEIARTLTLTLPDFEWSIEVDILGNHRVTIYFKGMDITFD